ncbi:hypothetical protein PTKIN_Ptkin01aG0018900 [Pterospermum kingtungense]
MVMGSRSMVVVVMEFVLVTFMKATIAVAAIAKPNCKSKCGDVTIPYPFGIGDGDCNLNSNFSITCNTSFNPPKPYMHDIEVLNVSLDGWLRILMGVNYKCSNESDITAENQWSLGLAKFSINSTRNKFTTTGCYSFAALRGPDPKSKYQTACTSFCNYISDTINGSCSGIGCCQSSFPKGVRAYGDIDLDIYNTGLPGLEENPCCYAFIAEDGNYTFSTSDILGHNFMDRKFPTTLDWTIGYTNCSEAKKDTTNFACKENSTCVDSENGGYWCKCINGYEGNPYLNGCQDINECHQTVKPCVGTCHNLPGGYNCLCPKGHEGDGKINGTGCNKLKGSRNTLVLGTICGILGLILAILLLYLMVKQRQMSKLKEKYFQQNGGNLLREQLSKREGYSEKLKIFAAEELKKATNNYHESKIIGKGGQGTVYRGILADDRVVAIKKSRVTEVETFINEIMVLCQINHRNVVKLLGCCLELHVPLLVYEYVTNGTLYDHLHKDGAASTLVWETRLKIATETAQVLSYLHSAASPPIIHRDVKLTNILLDENYNVKVSDFGTSRLNPLDREQITTLVKGTLGYLDPEYFYTSLLTEKSDVYSFGVVLMELLTGQKPLSSARPEDEMNLSVYFVSKMEKDLLLEILDKQVMNENTNIEQLKEVAALATRCVRRKGEERPTMKEIASDLEVLREMEKHP